MKSTIKRNLLLGFSLSLLLLIISSVASYNSIQNLLTSSHWVNHTDSVLRNLESVISTLKDAETGQRGFLLTGEEKFLEPYNGAYDKALNTINELKILTADNPQQQQSCDQLRSAITDRLSTLDKLIKLKQEGQQIATSQLELGKTYMDEVRALVKLMESREQVLLNVRTQTLNKYASFTPVLIFIAALLSVIITIFFFTRVNADIDKRAQLQKQLEDKDKEISSRIDIIQAIADKISAGNYAIRVNDAERDGLGSLAGSLNKMAESLEYSFGLLSNKEWLQTGIAKLNEKMIGEKDIKTLTENILNFVAEYTHSQSGAFYLLENDETLMLQSGYAFDKPAGKHRINKGEGVLGQCLAGGKEIIITNIPPENVSVSYATGAIKPRTVVALPVAHAHKINGVIELATVYEYKKVAIDFLQSISSAIGIAINSAQSSKKLQELLEETQAQSEELQAQQRELENINTELETQTESLQASEEELRVQQQELQQANEELEERTRSLEEKNQLIVERNLDIQKKSEELALSTKYKSEFLANMSHELRTPLNSILLLSRLLSENNETNLNEDQVASAKVILSSGNGLLSLIDEILDLSKIESGKMDVEYSHVSVTEIVDDMRSLFAPIAREKNLQLNIIVSNNTSSMLETDKMRLEQILKNLISNALKFTTKGSVTMKVEPGNESNDTIKFSVKDTGIGIAAEKHALIFEAFQQADGSTKRKYGGTGLGLSISRELAKLLGGDITLVSEAGKGSEFIVIMPVIKSAGQSKQTEDIDKEDYYAAAITPEPPAQKRKEYISAVIPSEIPDDRAQINKDDKVVFIVEDDTNFATSLLNFTKRKGYKAIVIVRGDEVLRMALQYQPVAVLLDIQLPVKDGWEVMAELKSNPKTRHIPVHIMSSIDAKKQSLQSGAVDFIDKPVALEQMQQMFEKLEDALNRHPKKVLIVEENPKHAEALAYFLESFNINAEIKNNVTESISSLNKKEVDCVILDMGVPDQNAYETLEAVKKSPGMENLPIIIFTGKHLSRSEESRIRQYADSIVVKTAHSYQRILDEVGLFLHLVEENDRPASPDRYKKLGALDEVLKNKKVLVADDDVRNIFSLTKALEQHSMKVYSAIDGREALQALDNNPGIDIVLMDMMMPEMDGYESIRKIRQNPRYKQLPVLAVTAKAMMGDREKCIAAGASDYISKPVDIDQLLSLLRVWLYNNMK
jgi:signal transduction histidine kinase/DNA-binding response OmpR family regulator/CHASE3 domain sensor protein